MSSSTPTPRNRRKKQANPKSANDPSEIDVPMVKPDYNSKPTGKTLFEIADERRSNLMDAASTKQREIDRKNGKLSTNEEFDIDGPLGAFGTALLYTISLSALHLTLDVLVLSQYQQDIVWAEIVARLIKLTPALLVAVWLAHTEQAKSLAMFRQLAFLATSIAVGCFIIKSGNVDGYYMVMKYVPPAGTIWVWSVVEMDLIYSVIHGICVGAFMWWKGYGRF